MKHRALALLLFTFLGLNAHADFNDGVVALMMGDHEKALSILLPLAETADHAYAQYFVGRMYAAGQGVEKSDETAAKWYRKAAESGVADAQYRLGGLYQRGEGVPRDMESAYSWYAVAAHLGNAKAITAVEQSAALLSPAEMEEAKSLSADLISKYGNLPKSTARTQ
jgi:TPR repeat protein